MAQINYIFQEFNLNYLAAAKQQTIDCITLKAVECEYEDGTKENKLCVDYRYDRQVDGRSTRMRLFPRYKISEKDIKNLDGTNVDNVWFRIGTYVDEKTGEATIGKPKWFAVSVNGETIDFSDNDLEEFVDHSAQQ